MYISYAFYLFTYLCTVTAFNVYHFIGPSSSSATVQFNAIFPRVSIYTLVVDSDKWYLSNTTIDVVDIDRDDHVLALYPTHTLEHDKINRFDLALQGIIHNNTFS